MTDLKLFTEQLRREEEQIRQGGGPGAIDRQHAKGRLTARERVAKLIDPEGGEETLRATALAFTPGYASPEQVQGGVITTATDVYSLGVLLYEMLTGHGPYRLGTRNPLEVLRAIVEQVRDGGDGALRALDARLGGGLPSVAGRPARLRIPRG